VPGIALEVPGRIVRRLADQDGVVVHLAHGGPDGAAHALVEILVAPTSGHVGDVHPPAVQGERRSQPARDHRVETLDEAAAQLEGLPVELGQAREPQPADVLGLLRVEPEIEGALGGIRVAVRGAEPLVRVTRVIGREVADHPQSFGVRCLDQRLIRLVATQQRIHVIEALGVVPVVRLGREDGGQIKQVHAKAHQVIQVIDDALQVAPVELSSGLWALEDDRIRPLRRHRPGRQRAVICCRGSRKAIREHLVHHRFGTPRGRRVVTDQAEVVDVARFGVRQPR
jgi:hypothetical protein